MPISTGRPSESPDKGAAKSRVWAALHVFTSGPAYFDQREMRYVTSGKVPISQTVATALLKAGFVRMALWSAGTLVLSDEGRRYYDALTDNLVLTVPCDGCGQSKEVRPVDVKQTGPNELGVTVLCDACQKERKDGFH